MHPAPPRPAWRIRLRRGLGAALAVAALAASGCQAPDPAAGIGRYVVKTRSAPFYKYGPAQSTGPDMTLKQGQALSVFRQQMGFAQVVLDDGVSGYVASSDLEPAPNAPHKLPEEGPEKPPRRSRQQLPDLPPPEMDTVEEPLGLPVLPDPGLFAPLPSEGEGSPEKPSPDSGGERPSFRF